MITSGKGKGRGKPDASLRQSKTWRTLVLSTAEKGLEAHVKEGKKSARAGQMVRMVDIPAIVKDAHGCFENLHGYAGGREFADATDGVCAEYHGVAGRVFLERMATKGLQDCREDLKRCIEGFVKDNTKDCGGQVQRVAARFGVVLAALQLATKLDVLPKTLSKEAAAHAIKTVYTAWLSERGSGGDFETARILESVVGVLRENADGKFKPHPKPTLSPYEKERILNTHWGYRNGDTYYVFPRAYKNELCTEEWGQTQVTGVLANAKMISKDPKGKWSHLKRCGGEKPTRYYVIQLPNEELGDSE